MDIQTTKLNLIHWLTELEDESVLQQVQALKTLGEKELSDDHKRLLDQRLAAYNNNPDDVLDWDEVVCELDKGL